MKVLHYIDCLRSEDLISDSVSELAVNQQKVAEVKVVTHKDDAAKVLKEFAPDVVHIHSVESYQSVMVEQSAMKLNIAVVVSPHGLLNRYILRKESPIRHYVKMKVWQQRMLKNADGLLLSDKYEAEQIEQYHVNHHLHTIANPLLDSAESPDGATEKVMSFYKKLLDTRYAYYMKSADYEAIYSLLHIGIELASIVDANDIIKIRKLDPERLLLLREITPKQWRHILLYADDEYIRSYINSAISYLQLQVPAIDTTAISRFAPSKPKQAGDLVADEFVDMKPRMQERWNEKIHQEPVALQQLVIMLYNAQRLESKEQLSEHHLACLYTAIKFTQYDEERLYMFLKSLRLVKFTQKILNKLTQKLLLEEGFVPLPFLHLGAAKHS